MTQDPDRELGGAFGALTLRELYVAVALVGALSRQYVRGYEAGNMAEEASAHAIDRAAERAGGVE
jgi:hypothetical protein